MSTTTAPRRTVADLLAADRAHVWHPYASATRPGPVRLVERAYGARLVLADDPARPGEPREVVDGMASWWAAVHGYAHPALDAAVTDQLGAMAHVMFGGLTHAPAVRLAERLVELTPAGLEHVFLADSGSVAVEVALKLAVQHQRGSGRPRRTRMLALRGGYHGDTSGAMSVCDPVGGMHALFPGRLAPQVFAPRPPACGADPAAVTAWVDEVRALARDHSDDLAAIVAEPLLQGAGGMHAYPAACLVALREIADEHGLLLVLDEIATGFGRTGTLFACDAAGVRPDVLCVGKALTGGYLSAAAVLCTREVARTVSDGEGGGLLHGPTFMGNPLSSAVALASLDLLADGTWADDVARIERGLATGLAPLRDLPGVRDVRTCGAVGVVQLDRPVDVPRATDAAVAAGAWLRPFRDLVYAMPPYVASDAEVATIVAGMTAAVTA
jgi:adenosylmethionine-8-amino-7-oxononanoate aminotransferase